MKKLLCILFLISVSFSFSQTVTPLPGSATFSLQALIYNKISTGTLAVSPSSGTLNVGGFSDIISVTPTISTSPAYSYSDCIGGIMSIPSSVRTSTGTAHLYGLIIWDASQQASSMLINFWNASPSGTYTDNSAVVFTGDGSKNLGYITVSSADYITLGGVSQTSVKSIGLLVKPATGTTVYATAVALGTPTYATTSALLFKFVYIQD